MNPRRVKQLLLAALLVVAGYIWWGNLALLFPAEPSTVDISSPGEPTAAPGGDGGRVMYREPKVNPFLHAVTVPAQGRTEQASTPKGPVPLPRTLQLVGVLCLGPSSQAVLQVDPQTTKVFTLGENLGEWTLMEVTDETAVFGAGRVRDTLLLVGGTPTSEE